MNIKIVTDSCCDLPKDMLNQVEIVPLTISIDGKHYKDGVDLSRDEFYTRLAGCKKLPGTASPSPGDFLEKFDGAGKVFIVTISSNLSSTFNTAVIAKDLYCEQFSDRLVYIFDSLNASVGQGLVVLKLRELIQKNLTDAKIVQSLLEYIKGIKTFFVLENIENLVNSGRVNRILGKIISVLNIKFIMGNTPEGEIELFEKVRGSHRVFNKLLDLICKHGSNFEDKILGIAHGNCLQKAKQFKEEVEKRYNFKEIIITQIGPTIAAYASEGALLISF